MRKLEIIGLSALVALSLSAISAPSSNAAEGTLTASAGKTGYAATQTGPGLTLTLAGGRVFGCESTTFAGTVADGDKWVTLPTFFYAKCSVKVFETVLPATISMLACDYRFTDLSAVSLGTFSAQTDLVCSGGGDIHIKVYVNAAEHEKGLTLCEYTIPAYSGITGVHLENTSSGELDIEWTEATVTYTRTIGTIGNCGPAMSVARYDGNVMVQPGSGTLEIH